MPSPSRDQPGGWYTAAARSWPSRGLDAEELGVASAPQLVLDRVTEVMERQSPLYLMQTLGPALYVVRGEVCTNTHGGFYVTCVSVHRPTPLVVVVGVPRVLTTRVARTTGCSRWTRSSRCA